MDLVMTPPEFQQADKKALFTLASVEITHKIEYEKIRNLGVVLLAVSFVFALLLRLLGKLLRAN